MDDSVENTMEQKVLELYLFLTCMGFWIKLVSQNETIWHLD